MEVLQEEYKDTKVGRIPKDWGISKLSELATFRRGSFPQPYGLPEWYDEENGLPFIQVYDVDSNFKLKPTTKQKISKIGAEKSVFIKKGTLIITIQGSIGRIAITQYDAYIDRTLLIFQSFLKPLDKVYFANQLNVLFNKERQKANGSTIKTITKAQLSNFIIPLPPLPEQEKIAEILSTVDEQISTTQAIIDQSKELKKGLMQKLFSEGIGHTEFKDTKIGRIPKSWEYVKIEKHINLFYGNAFKSSDFNEEGIGTKLLRGVNITVGKLRWNKKIDRYINLPFDDYVKFSAKEGDLVISMDGSLVGRNFARVKKSDLPLLIVQRIACIRAKNTLNLEYLNQLIGSSSFINYVDAVKTNSGIPHISGKDIKNFKIPLPSIIEQEKIANILSEVDTKIEKEEKEKEQLEQLKKGLMQQLLTGQKRVKV